MPQCADLRRLPVPTAMAEPVACAVATGKRTHGPALDDPLRSVAPGRLRLMRPGSRPVDDATLREATATLRQAQPVDLTEKGRAKLPKKTALWPVPAMFTASVQEGALRVPRTWDQRAKTVDAQSQLSYAPLGAEMLAADIAEAAHRGTKAPNWKFVLLRAADGEVVFRAGDKQRFSKVDGRGLHHPTLADAQPILTGGVIELVDGAVELAIDSGNYGLDALDDAGATTHRQRLEAFLDVHGVSWAHVPQAQAND